MVLLSCSLSSETMVVNLLVSPMHCLEVTASSTVEWYKRCQVCSSWQDHLELVYLVTALVPSDTACLASSPGSSRRTAVWISRDVMVERLL